MTDLEMTRLCSQAMKLIVQYTTGETVWRFPETLNYYDPLFDDAQAMALLKEMELSVRAELNVKTSEKYWSAMYPGIPLFWTKNTYLNRAIVECVAKMQAAKVTA